MKALQRRRLQKILSKTAVVISSSEQLLSSISFLNLQFAQNRLYAVVAAEQDIIKAQARGLKVPCFGVFESTIFNEDESFEIFNEARDLRGKNLNRNIGITTTFDVNQFPDEKLISMRVRKMYGKKFILGIDPGSSYISKLTDTFIYTRIVKKLQPSFYLISWQDYLFLKKL